MKEGAKWTLRFMGAGGFRCPKVPALIAPKAQNPLVARQSDVQTLQAECFTCKCMPLLHVARA